MADRIGSDHQRVMILSVYHNAFLCATDPRDEDQREVIVGKSAELSRLNEWRLIPVDGAGQKSTIHNASHIVHHQFNEPLFAAVDALAFDEERRTVLTWIPGKQQRDLQSSWEFLHGPEGHYLIKNVDLGEYLYASEQLAKGRVFTWRKSRDSLNRQCYWDIINVN